MEGLEGIIDQIANIASNKGGTEEEMAVNSVMTAAVICASLVKAVHMIGGVDLRKGAIDIIEGTFDETLLNKEAV